MPISLAPIEPADFDPYDILLSNSFADKGRDTDGDSRFDTLDVAVGLDVQKTGTYTVTGDLYSNTNGPLPGASTTVTFTTTGVHTATLSFDGADIRQYRADGPYSLQYLAIYNAAGDQLDLLTDAYTTTAYAYTAFQRGDAELTGSYSDVGVDTDGNGKYNLLRFTAGVNVFAPGVYSLVAALYANQDRTIAWASQTYTLTAGLQTVSLDFDGLAIGNSRVDGPYTLSAPALLDASGKLVGFEPEPYTTAPYAYTDFELPGIISGTVRDQDGSPLSGVLIAVSGRTEASRATDADGRFTIRYLPAGSYTIYAVSPPPTAVSTAGSGVGSASDLPIYTLGLLDNAAPQAAYPFWSITVNDRHVATWIQARVDVGRDLTTAVEFRKAQSPETGDILFVADAGGFATDSFQPYYTRALESLGYHYDIWDTGMWGPPDNLHTRPLPARRGHLGDTHRWISHRVVRDDYQRDLASLLKQWRKAVYHRPEPCGAAQHRCFAARLLARQPCPG